MVWEICMYYCFYLVEERRDLIFYLWCNFDEFFMVCCIYKEDIEVNKFNVVYWSFLFIEFRNFEFIF